MEPGFGLYPILIWPLDLDKAATLAPTAKRLEVRGVLVTDRCIVLSPAFIKELFCLRFGQVPTQNKFTHGEVAAPIRINELEPQKKTGRGGVRAHGRKTT